MISTPNGSAGRLAPGALHPASDADAGRQLARRFREAVAHTSPESMVALKAATVALAASMRAGGRGPERDLVALKAMLREHGDAGWAPSFAVAQESAPVAREVRVYEQVFLWWVSAYYGETSPSTGPR